MPIAYYLKKNPSADDNTLKDVILWLVKALLTGEFRGSGDTVLNRYRNEIDENTQVWFSSINVTLLQKTIKDLVDHAKYHGKETQLLLFLATDNHYWEKQQDHIYCQSRYRKRFGRNIDSIGNLELMSRTTNSVEKSDMSAIEWYNKITEEDRKANLYPEGILPTDENFEEFIEARKKLIIKTVCEKMGISYTE